MGLRDLVPIKMINSNKIKNWNLSPPVTKDSLIAFCEAMINNLNTTENKIFFNDLLTDLQAGFSASNPPESPISIPAIILQPINTEKSTTSPYVLLDKKLVPDGIRQIKLSCKSNSMVLFADLQTHRGLVFILDSREPLTYHTMYQKLKLERIEAVQVDFCLPEKLIN